MKFILTSNSYMVTKSWSQQFGLTPTKMKVAFIDTAADMYNKVEAKWLQADRTALVDVGFTVTDYTLVGKDREQLIADLSEFDVLFLSGGNSFYLLEQSNISGFSQLIKEDSFPDKIFVGSSAGSVLLSNDISAIQFLDDPKKATLESYEAVGIVNFVIFPHWGSPKFKAKYLEAIDYAYEHAIQALLLADTQYGLVEDGKFLLISV